MKLRQGSLLPEAIIILDRRLRAVWDPFKLNRELLTNPSHLPQFTFGNWVGRSRWTSFCYSASYSKTLEDLRVHALMMLREYLQVLAEQASLSDRLQTPPPMLQEKIQQMIQQLGTRGTTIILRNEGESWRQMVNLMIARLPIQSTSSNAGKTH